MTQDQRTKFNAQIAEEAAEWFVDFRLGNIDTTGRREFDSWIRSSPENLRAYLETAAIWNEGSSLSAHGDPDSDGLIALALTEGNVVPLEPDRLRSREGTQPRRDDASRGSYERVGETPSGERIGRTPGSEGAGRSASGEGVGRSPIGGRAGGSFSGGRLFAVAASIFLVTAALAVFLLTPGGVYATAVGERRILTLEDGSTVELNSRSRIRVRFAKSLRDVELLEGQVLFHVAKDSSRPFIVHSDTVSVRAVGTEFDVNRKTTGTTVTVVEGRVAVGNPVPGSTIDPGIPGTVAIFLSPGDQLTVTAQAPPPSQPQHANPAVATAWTQGQLVLDGASLAEVAEEFSRYSSRRLIVEDHGTRPLRLSGVFATNPEFLLRYLRQRADITIEATPTEVRIIHHD